MRRASCGATRRRISLTSSTVLLTRPEAESREVAGTLAAMGIRSVIWPMTRIEFVDGPVGVPEGTDGLVFTSRNGVAAFARSCAERGLTAWCVGGRTADAARDAGFADVVSADGDVDALAALLRQEAGGSRRLLYLRGREVSADLGAMLSGSGNILESRVVYAAQAGGPPPADVRTMFETGAIGVVAVWSRRAARELAGHLAQHPGWARGVLGVAISDRAGAPLADSGLDGMVSADRPDAEAMLEAISAAVRQKTG